jgi:excisionase family DNA binding protein
MSTKHADNIPSRLSRAEAAKYLGLSPNTLARWAVDGTHRLPYYRIGNRTMYDTPDLDALLARSRITFPDDDAT